MRHQELNEMAAYVIHWSVIIGGAMLIGSCLYGLSWLMMAAIP